jgi:hypothetical protein
VENAYRRFEETSVSIFRVRQSESVLLGEISQFFYDSVFVGCESTTSVRKFALDFCFMTITEESLELDT